MDSRTWNGTRVLGQNHVLLSEDFTDPASPVRAKSHLPDSTKLLPNGAFLAISFVAISFGCDFIPCFKAHPRAQAHNAVNVLA
jgi:hypothetical protein